MKGFSRVRVFTVILVEALAPVHEAQLLTYLRLGGWRLGLLINFNVAVLKSGIRRRILGYEEEQAASPGKDLT